MFFSKSFGYALRSTLYLATYRERKSLVRLEEIAEHLDIPRHFLGKILKKLAKEGLLVSAKGPNGGFGVNEKTLQTPLTALLEQMGQMEKADSCVLLLQKCDPDKPCALHHHVALVKKDWVKLLSATTVGMLLTEDMPATLQELAVIN
jgi:Rrf2 family transcriptional regulator, iron-sulfur cluster assembly transcription factor